MYKLYKHELLIVLHDRFGRAKNNRALIEKQKQLSNALLWANDINPDDGLEDDEILNILIDDLSQPQQDQMEPFTPVVINILRSWLQA